VDRLGEMRSDMLDGTTNGHIMPVTQGLDGLPKIAEQVPPISDLNSTRRTLADAVGVGTCTIAGDDLDARAVPQPSGQRCGFTIREKVDHLVRLQVDQHSAVVTATSPRPVVDTQNPRRCDGSDRLSGRQSEQRVRAGGHRDAYRQAGSGFAAECQAKLVLKIAQPDGPAPEQEGYVRQTLGKRQAQTVAVYAVEPPGRDEDYHRSSLPWQIMQLPLI
jgi:hypothetical protein